jgi:hypothetical protein
MSTDPSQHSRDPNFQRPAPQVPQVPQPTNYPPLPPPPAPQLPDFQPKGMKTIDKILAWSAAFAVLIFCMIVAAHYLLKPAPASPVKPTVTHSAAATAHAKGKVAVTCSK